MLRGELQRDEEEDSRVRVPIKSSVQRVPGVNYPPNPATGRKDKKRSESSREKKRAKHAEAEKEAAEKAAKKNKSVMEGPSWAVATANHTFYNTSVLKATDEATAIQYMQGLAATADWNTLKSLDNKTYRGQFALMMSKVNPLQHSLPCYRSNIGNLTLHLSCRLFPS
jgi:hypothetical protein